MSGLDLHVFQGDQQLVGIAVYTEHLFRLRPEESLVVHVVNERDQRVVVALDVEEADGAGVETELGPGEDLEEFVERADAAGERDEAASDVGHHLFALMHGVDDVQGVDAGVPEFAVHELLGDDAGDDPAVGEHGIGDMAHQAGAAAAVDQINTTFGHGAAEGPRGVRVYGTIAVCGSAVHAQRRE